MCLFQTNIYEKSLEYEFELLHYQHIQSEISLTSLIFVRACRLCCLMANKINKMLRHRAALRHGKVCEYFNVTFQKNLEYEFDLLDYQHI